MANYMWLAPTDRKYEFNKNKVFELLHYHFDQYIFTTSSENEIEVYRKDRTKVAGYSPEYLFSITFVPFPNFVDREDVIGYYDGIDDQDMSDKLIRYFDNMDTDISIEIRHTPHFNDIKNVFDWFRRYFQCLIFDEGIYPEVITPLPMIEKTKKVEKKGGFIKNIKDFWKI